MLLTKSAFNCLKDDIFFISFSGRDEVKERIVKVFFTKLQEKKKKKRRKNQKKKGISTPMVIEKKMVE